MPPKPRLLRWAACAGLIAPPRAVSDDLGRAWSEGGKIAAAAIAPARSGT
jgi:hypothetical protein